MDKIPIALYSAIDRDLTVMGAKTVAFYRSCPSPLPDFTHLDMCAYSLVHSLGKKFLPRNTDEQDLACLLKFQASNSLAGTWVDGCETSLDETLMGNFKEVIYRFFNPGGLPLVGSLDDIFLLGRCGPGASLMSAGGDFYSKMFSSRLTTTSRVLVDHYRTNVRRWPEWSNAETIRRETFGDPYIVDGSRLSFVPKNERISRAICTEPTLNMFYQLGLGTLLTRQLFHYFNIDLAKQPDRNREMARLGSLDDSLCTIDLESASDSVSLGMLRACFPRDVVSLLQILRSPVTSYNGDVIDLKMVSSMGNGFTFPLQTIIFASIVKSAYNSLGIPFIKGSQGNFGVFGDDIIVVKEARYRVLRLLALLGFRVNVDKSFFEGPFRESCGSDFFRGRDVRGIYITRLTSVQDWYAAINLVSDFSASTGIVLCNLMSCMLAHVDRTIEIPPWEDPASGIRLPLDLVKVKTLCKNTQGILYNKYENVAKKVRIRDRGPIRVNGRSVIYNPSGLLIAFLSGMALSSGLPVRQHDGKGNWKKKRLRCSKWDTLESESARKRRFDWPRWKSAVYFNLYGLK